MLHKGQKHIIWVCVAIITLLVGWVITLGVDLPEKDRLLESVLFQGADKNATILLDPYDAVSAENTLAISGIVESAVPYQRVTLYRIDEAGEILPVDDALDRSPDEENNAIVLEGRMTATVENGQFSLPPIYLSAGSNQFFVRAEVLDENGDEVSFCGAIVRTRYDIGQLLDLSDAQVLTDSDGFSYVAGIVAVTFRSSVSDESARQIIGELGGTVSGYISILRHYQVSVSAPDESSLRQFAADAVSRYPNEIVSAELERVNSLSPQNVVISDAFDTMKPNDPWGITGAPHDWSETNPGGDNWNLEIIQAVSALEFEPYYRQVRVGVIDVGFFDGHDDLRLFYTNDFRRVDAHGTHVAGVIGSAMNNEIGINGILGEQGRLIVHPLQGTVNGDSITLTRSDELMALVSCVTNGSSVVNLSMSNMGPHENAEERYREAIAYSLCMAELLKAGYDFVLVQSAGNDCIDAMHAGMFSSVYALNDSAMSEVVSMIQSDYGLYARDITSRVIMVASCGYDGQTLSVSDFSNFGDIVRICAPGEQILSTVPGGFNNMGGYQMMSGTSMAAPHVAAVAALVMSANSAVTGADVLRILEENYCYTATSNENEQRPELEYHVVNAYLAVRAALPGNFVANDAYAEIFAKDAENGEGLQASVSVYRGVRAGGELVQQVMTDPQGNLTLELEEGDFYIEISCEGYISYRGTFHLNAGQTLSSAYPLSRMLGANEIRIVLSWGETPSDLDSHLVGRDRSGNPFHVYFPSRDHFVNGQIFATLDVDDTSSYGPETITIAELPTTPLVYCVHNFSDGGRTGTLRMAQSNMVVKVYRGNEEIATYTAPVNRAGEMWRMFSIQPDGSIVDIDEMVNGPISASEVR